MGEEGSLLWHERAPQKITYTPAFAVKEVIDTTGAGNSFCGAFLVGLAAGRDPEWSAALSTAVASFTVEQYGIPLKGSVQELAPKRLHQVIGMQQTLEFSD